MEVETEDLCNVCGEQATRYLNSFPICDNPVCLQVRLEHVQEVIKEMNNKIERQTCV